MMQQATTHDQGVWFVQGPAEDDPTIYCIPPDAEDPDDYITVGWLTDWSDTDQANGRLISAAPDLLAACREALAWLNRFGEHSPIVFGGEAELADTLIAAIGKAEQD